MGGILAKDETPTDRYAKFKKVSERYSMIQLGISLFENVPEAPGKFHVVRICADARPILSCN